MDGSLGANKIVGWFIVCSKLLARSNSIYMYVFLDAFYSFCLRESVGHRHQHLHDNFHTYTFSYFTKMDGKIFMVYCWIIGGVIKQASN